MSLIQVPRLKVAELKAEPSRRSLSTEGPRPVLAKRLQAALDKQRPDASVPVSEEETSPPPSKRARNSSSAFSSVISPVSTTRSGERRSASRAASASSNKLFRKGSTKQTGFAGLSDKGTGAEEDSAEEEEREMIGSQASDQEWYEAKAIVGRSYWWGREKTSWC